MELCDAIKIALNGEAILFAGSGFSSGAKNQKGGDFEQAAGLCRLMCDELKMEYDNDLSYVSERYIEISGEDSLIDLLQQQYIARQVSESHKYISKVKWKRIYTTNYDDIIEKASDSIGFYRIPVTLSKKPYEVNNKANVVVHLNGFIKDLNSDRLYSEFKLSRASYLNDEFTQSEWLHIFRQDIKNSEAVFFVGYSLDYDIDIQRILIQDEGLREKCFFITLPSLSAKSMHVMNKFGSVQTIGIDSFAKIVEELNTSYIPVEKVIESFICFEQYSKDNFRSQQIVDSDILDLFIKGKININHIRNYSGQKKYFIERKEVSKIISDLDSGLRVAVVHSDLGNGKTGVVCSLISRLVEQGLVFKLNEITDRYSREVEKISSYREKKYIVVEDYNLYLKYLRDFNLYRTDIKFILTARSLINDVFYLQMMNDLKLEEEEVGIYEVNLLDKKELGDLISIFDEYNLWGKKSATSKSGKMKLVKNHGKFQNILLDLLKSEYIGKQVNKLVKTLKTKPVLEDVVLVAFINSILSLNLDLSTIVYLLDNVLFTAKLLKSTDSGELIDISQNKVAVKSSILANYILKENDYSTKIIELLIKIMKNADKHRNEYQYEQIMKVLVSFSNIKLLLKERGREFAKNIIRYYESIKNLDFNKENPHFWLQYAIARLELKEFKEAKIYFDNAYAYGQSKSFNFDTYQIDTHYSRFLLERQIEEGTSLDAYLVFKEAHDLLIVSNKNRPENFHYPLRQTRLYYDFYNKFFTKLGITEKAKFLMCCKQALDKVHMYFTAIKNLERNRHPDVTEAEKRLKSIILNSENYSLLEGSN